MPPPGVCWRGISPAGGLPPALAAQLGEQQLGVHRADQVAQRLGAGGDDLGRALDGDLAGEPVQQRADLGLDERLQRVAVAAACRTR